MKRRFNMLIALALLAVGFALRVSDPEIVQGFRVAVFDTFQKIEPREYRPAPVRIVDLDDETLERLGQWPWPRTLVARLVSRLTELGWSPSMSLRDGLAATYRWFCENAEP